MKKKVFFVLVALMVGFGLSGCNINTNKTDDADTGSTGQSSTENLPTPPVPAAPTD